MSWMKRRSPAAPNTAPTPPVQLYNPNQHSNQDQWQQPVANNWYHQNPQNDVNQHQQTNYWQTQYAQQPPQPQITQHQHQPPQQQQQQQQQHTPYNQYQNQYNQQTNPQPGYYQQPQNYDQNYGNSRQFGYTQENVDYTEPGKTEADSWNWGWGDEDNSNLQHHAGSQSAVTNVNSSKSFAESFANDESWNWNVEDSATSLIKHESTNASSTEDFNVADGARQHELPKISDSGKADKKLENAHFQVKPELPIDNYESVSLNQLPPLPTGKRTKSEHLTPQWSIESQVSQESSDDVLPTSESDKSHLFSRSSTISHSPVSGQQTPSEPQYPEQYHLKSEPGFETFNRETSNLHENKEILSEIKEELPQNNDVSPPPPMKNQTPPPSNSTGSNNPYKRNTGPSHKMMNKSRGGLNDARPSTYYMQPFASTFNQSVNLETVPDNSEQPDVIHAPNPTMKPVVSQQFPENNEVAPINDRNQYLETGQLSDENTNQIREDNSDTLPPPGLSRMVLGQLEQVGDNGREVQGDFEPPPGLSRMVLGQTENSSSNQMNSPPAGLHRMVPGESSSPETSSRYPNICLEDDYVSETELNHLSQISSQSRSATIGADTPPVDGAILTNRSETIGSNGTQRETVLDGANLSDVNGDRRDSIEGQPQMSDMDNLVVSVRDMVVGENPTDVPASSKLAPETSRRHETTDSEGDHDRGKSPNAGRDRRYNDDRRDKDRIREHYSPDYGRDKRRDGRRYRDRYLEDDTDYFSDKERDKRRDERDRKDGYDKKYNSLRRDKDKDRHRRDGREYRDTRREYYFNQYEENYDDVQRSRPSSRSDSMHDSYRDRPHEREHHRHRDRDREHRRHRQPFAPYMQGYGYDPYSPYYQQYQYQYLENLRRTNPQAYAEWYRKYYQSGQQSGQFNAEDKTSVHSGRSSTNDELAKERYLRQSYYGQSNTPQLAGYYREQHNVSSHYGMDDSISRPFEYADSSLNFEENTASQRLTPAKFPTAHVKASIASGHMLTILPHYPLDGQVATVEFGKMQTHLQGDDELRELMDFPGPLVKGATHKKTIIEYCENKIRNYIGNEESSDPDSYILMWELLILLLRQNGMVVGTDIAELLMKDRKSDHSLRPSSVVSNNSGVADVSDTNYTAGDQSIGGNSIMKEEYVTNKFREYLLYGSGKEALEWAMKHSLWGHALFLASKLDKRTYASVMMRFANGLPMNDPLQTLYQLLSGRLPASVTSVCDEKWGDWRPHLAMILSNTTQRPELDRKAITTLADTLMSRGSLYAAQFCYLMAEVGFSRYGSDGAKLVLLGANHSKPFTQFATNEAIHMTEVYEYACSLNDPSFIIPEFQAYKYLIATRLADRGFLEDALTYLEQVACGILQNPTAAQPSMINKVCELAERLKYYDPVVETDDNDEEVDLDSSRPDNTWLRDLKSVQQEYNMGLITHESLGNLNILSTNSLQDQTLSYDHSPQDPWQSQQQMEQENYHQTSQPAWPSEPQIEQTNASVEQESSQEDYNGQFQEQSWTQQQQWSVSQPTVDAYGGTRSQEHVSSDPQQDYWNNTQPEDAPRPQISMPNQGKSSYFEDDKQSGRGNDASAKPKQSSKKDDKATSNNGWFGGIWSRLALRPKNQMKLPDDKNPTIVWDQEKKRWVNLEEDSNDTASEVRPPPKMMDMMQKAHAPAPSQSAPQALMPNKTMYNTSGVPPPHEDVGLKPTEPNMFKLQRSRNLKKSYIDIFNTGGKGGSNAPALPPNTDGFGGGKSIAPPQMNFFIPAPVTDPNAPIDFLTPIGAMPFDPNSQPTYQSQ